MTMFRIPTPTMALSTATTDSDSSLLFSRWMDGSDGFKLLQISNPTDSAVQLRDIKLHTKMVGKKSQQESTITLEEEAYDNRSLIIAPGEVFTLCTGEDKTNAKRGITCDAQVGSHVLGLNGNDSAELLVNDEIVDIMGNFDETLRNDVFTVCGDKNGMRDRELIRFPSVQKGNTKPFGSFDSCEWESFRVPKSSRTEDQISLKFYGWVDGDGYNKQLSFLNPTDNNIPYSDISFRTRLSGDKGKIETIISLDELEARRPSERDYVRRKEIVTLCSDQGLENGDLNSADARHCDFIAPNRLIGLNGNDSIELLVKQDFPDGRYSQRVDILGDFNSPPSMWEICSTEKTMVNSRLFLRNLNRQFAPSELNRVFVEDRLPLHSFKKDSAGVCPWEIYAEPINRVEYEGVYEDLPNCRRSVTNPKDRTDILDRDLFNYYTRSELLCEKDSDCDGFAERHGIPYDCFSEADSDSQIVSYCRANDTVRFSASYKDELPCIVDAQCYGVSEHCSIEGACRATSLLIKQKSESRAVVLEPEQSYEVTFDIPYGRGYNGINPRMDWVFKFGETKDVRIELTKQPAEFTEAIGVLYDGAKEAPSCAAEDNANAEFWHLQTEGSSLGGDVGLWGLWAFNVTNTNKEVSIDFLGAYYRNEGFQD